jgi:hypothetical protein
MIVLFSQLQQAGNQPNFKPIMSRKIADTVNALKPRRPGNATAAAAVAAAKIAMPTQSE